MMTEQVIAVFDIGKTNKKFLLFNAALNLVFQNEVRFAENRDDDDFACDDIEKIETWMKSSLEGIIREGKYEIRAMNISTYGATLMYLDKKGNRLTPVYNYLKPMPEEVMTGFYEQYGGKEEFCRRTASPALGMLNSGLQIRWLKKKRPEIFQQVFTTLHFPQYLSFLFTGSRVSELTSIGCHTAMWDFDVHTYHQWISDEGLSLPAPVTNDTTFDAKISDSVIVAGIGIHDSSASLVPYLEATEEKFILISTGTWCIFMNPFNNEPLTREELSRDTLCYMSIRQKQVKSSRLFLGHIHDVNVDRLNKHFGVTQDFYKTLKASGSQISALLNMKGKVFFKDGIPPDYLDQTVELGRFTTFEEAYHQFMSDLVELCMESLSLVIPADDQTKLVFITGGFARNEIFTKLFSGKLPGRRVCISETDNCTALGAAMVVWEKAFQGQKPTINLGLQEIHIE